MIRSNSTAILPLLIQTFTKAVRMYDRGAFVHSYIRFGASDRDFREAFAAVQRIIRDYAALSID